MGVRGLQTYLEQFCPEACFPVDLIKLVQEYQSANGKPAEIVVDAQSCYNLWCKDIDWLVGFEMQEFIFRLKTFVDSFTKIGAKLVFFFGGLTPEKKRDVWLRRRLKNVQDVLTIFDILNAGKTIQDIPKHVSSIPPNMGFTTSLILKYILNCEVYTSVAECDEEIVHYAHKHDSFAIFGQDTDFIISDINAIVLSSKNFNILKMTTLLYDRIKLSQCLRMPVNKLPMLAILAGNDLIPFDTIREFHLNLCRVRGNGNIPFQILIPAIARFINDLPALPVDNILSYICKVLYKDNSKKNLLKMVYDSYIIHDEPNLPAPTDKWPQILKVARYRHRNATIPSYIWSIINDQIFECSVAFEDVRIIHDRNDKAYKTPSATVTRSLRQRLYGILLYECENPSGCVREWCGENNDTSYREPVLVKPIPPKVQHPGLLSLWSDNNGDRLNKIRWTLFINSVLPNITDTREWTLLEEDILIATMSLYYLYNRRYILKSELFAIMATIATYGLYDNKKLQSLSYGSLDMKAVHLSVTFIRTYGFVIGLLAACGYPVPMSANMACMKFEGKLFQIKFNECVKQKKSFKEICENDRAALQIFYRIKNTIIKDYPKPFQTFNWGSNGQVKNSGPTEKI